MKRRGMEAVAAKSARRTPVFLRKKMQEDAEDAPETPEPEKRPLECPKCGAELADTPENREYAKMRAAEAEDEMDDEEESMEEESMDEAEEEVEED